MKDVSNEQIMKVRDSAVHHNSRQRNIGKNKLRTGEAKRSLTNVTIERRRRSYSVSSLRGTSRKLFGSMTHRMTELLRPSIMSTRSTKC